MDLLNLQFLKLAIVILTIIVFYLQISKHNKVLYFIMCNKTCFITQVINDRYTKY